MTIQNIIKVVCEERNVPMTQISKKSRKREICQERQIIHYFCKLYTVESLYDIAMKVGGVTNHATVIHSCKTISNAIDTDKKFAEKINVIRERIELTNNHSESRVRPSNMRLRLILSLRQNSRSRINANLN